MILFLSNLEYSRPRSSISLLDFLNMDTNFYGEIILAGVIFINILIIIISIINYIRIRNYGRKKSFLDYLYNNFMPIGVLIIFAILIGLFYFIYSVYH